MATVERRVVKREEVVLPKPELTDEDWARILLSEAGDLLEEHWIQGSLSDGRGNYCAIGAIGRIYEKNKDIPRRPGIKKLAERLLALSIAGKKNVISPGDIIVNYNDRPGRRRNTLVRAFRKAASLDKA